MTAVTTGDVTPTALVADATTIIEVEKAFEQAGMPVLDFASLTGDSWGDVVEKDTLVGVPFIIVETKWHEGDFGAYAAVLAITKDNRRVVFTDGSTGIYAQLQRLQEMTGGRLAGIACRNGLRRSDYEHNGRSARTYYLAN